MKSWTSTSFITSDTGRLIILAVLYVPLDYEGLDHWWGPQRGIIAVLYMWSTTFTVKDSDVILNITEHVLIRQNNTEYGNSTLEITQEIRDCWSWTDHSTRKMYNYNNISFLCHKLSIHYYVISSFMCTPWPPPLVEIWPHKSKQLLQMIIYGWYYCNKKIPWC